MKMYKNLPGLLEVSIGHALTADALRVGFSNAVKAYQQVCQ
jgi:pyridoxine 5-phosphate synthase